eukprot:TRINITY_DN15490_c0_g1_i1.p1 TRINITY_DN15490_c0_g1~~TRINITY_DN15490_c0_g1_i1.p1  ORF type:complete len:2257 (+),score=548.68 TRINITY_DN15490_c0_g1_i1:84-6854(+)
MKGQPNRTQRSLKPARKKTLNTNPKKVKVTESPPRGWTGDVSPPPLLHRKVVYEEEHFPDSKLKSYFDILTEKVAHHFRDLSNLTTTHLKIVDSYALGGSPVVSSDTNAVLLSSIKSLEDELFTARESLYSTQSQLQHAEAAHEDSMRGVIDSLSQLKDANATLKRELDQERQRCTELKKMMASYQTTVASNRQKATNAIRTLTEKVLFAKEETGRAELMGMQASDLLLTVEDFSLSAVSFLKNQNLGTDRELAAAKGVIKSLSYSVEERDADVQKAASQISHFQVSFSSLASQLSTCKDKLSSTLAENDSLHHDLESSAYHKQVVADLYRLVHGDAALTDVSSDETLREGVRRVLQSNASYRSSFETIANSLPDPPSNNDRLVSTVLTKIHEHKQYLETLQTIAHSVGVDFSPSTSSPCRGVFSPVTPPGFGLLSEPLSPIPKVESDFGSPMSVGDGLVFSPLKLPSVAEGSVVRTGRQAFTNPLITKVASIISQNTLLSSTILSLQVALNDSEATTKNDKMLINSLQTELVTARNEINTLIERQSEYEKLELELESAVSEVENIKSQNVLLETTCAELTSQVHQLQDVSKECSILQTHLESAESDLRESLSKIANLEEACTSLSSSNRILEKKNQECNRANGLITAELEESKADCRELESSRTELLKTRSLLSAKLIKIEREMGDLQIHFQSIHSELGEALKEKSTTEQTCRNLKGQNKSLSKKCDEVEARLESVHIELLDSINDNQLLKTTCANLASAKEFLAKELSSVGHQLVAADSCAQDFRSQSEVIASLEATIASLTEQNITLSQQVNVLQSDLLSSSACLNELSAAEATITSLRQSLASMTEDNSTIARTITEMTQTVSDYDKTKKQVTELEEQTMNMSQQLLTLTDTANRQTDRCELLEKSNQQLKIAISDANDENRTKTATIAELTELLRVCKLGKQASDSNLAASSEECKRLQCAIAEREKMITTLSEEKDSQTRTVSELMEKIEISEAQQQSMMNNATAQSSEYNKLQATVAELESTIASLAEQNNSKTSAVVELTNKLVSDSSCVNEVMAAEKTITSLEETIAAITEAAKQHENENATLRSEIKNLQSQIIALGSCVGNNDVLEHLETTVASLTEENTVLRCEVERMNELLTSNQICYEAFDNQGKQINDLKEAVTELTDNNITTTTRLEAADKTATRLRTSNDALLHQQHALVSENDKLHTQLITAHCCLKEADFASAKVVELEKNCSTLIEEKEQLRSQINNQHDDRIHDLEQQCSSLISEKEKLRGDAKSLEAELVAVRSCAEQGQYLGDRIVELEHQCISLMEEKEKQKALLADSAISDCRIAEVERQCACLMEQKEELRQYASNLEAQLQTARTCSEDDQISKMEQLQLQYATLFEKKQKMRQNLEALATGVPHLEHRCRTLLDENQQLQTQLHSSKESATQLNTLLTEQRLLTSEITNQLEQQKKSLMERNASEVQSKETITELELLLTKEKDLNQQLSISLEETNVLQRQLTAELDHSNQKLNQLEQEHESIRDNSQSDQKVNDLLKQLETERTQSTEKITELELQKVSGQEENAKLQTMLADERKLSGEKIKRLEAECTSLIEEKDQCEEDTKNKIANKNNDLLQHLETLQTRQHVTENALAELEEQYSDLLHEKEDLLHKLGSLSSSSDQIAALEEKCGELATEKEAAVEQVRVLQQKGMPNESLQTEQASLLKEKDELNDHIESLRMQLLNTSPSRKKENRLTFEKIRILEQSCSSLMQDKEAMAVRISELSSQLGSSNLQQQNKQLMTRLGFLEAQLSPDCQSGYEMIKSLQSQCDTLTAENDKLREPYREGTQMVEGTNYKLQQQYDFFEEIIEKMYATHTPSTAIDASLPIEQKCTRLLQDMSTCAGLQRRCSDLQQQTGSLTSTINQLQSRLAAVVEDDVPSTPVEDRESNHKEREDLIKCIEHLRSQLAAANRCTAATREEVDYLRDQISNQQQPSEQGIRSKISALRLGDADLLAEENENLRQSLKVAKDSHQALQSANLALTEQADELHSRLQDRDNKLTERVAHLESCIDSCQDPASPIRATDSLMTKIDAAFKTQMKEIERHLTSSHKRLAKDERSTKSLRDKVTNLELQISQADLHHLDLEQCNNCLIECNASLIERLITLEQSLEEVTDQAPPATNTSITSTEDELIILRGQYHQEKRLWQHRRESLEAANEHIQDSLKEVISLYKAASDPVAFFAAMKAWHRNNYLDTPTDDVDSLSPMSL